MNLYIIKINNTTDIEIPITDMIILLDKIIKGTTINRKFIKAMQISIKFTKLFLKL
jgi:hypothetical protein